MGIKDWKCKSEIHFLQSCRATVSWVLKLVRTYFAGPGIGFGFGYGWGFGVGWGWGGVPLNFLGLEAGVVCGVGLGLGRGFGIAFSVDHLLRLLS